MFRIIHRFFVALFVKETTIAFHTGKQMRFLQDQLEDFGQAQPATENQSEEVARLISEANKLLSHAKTLIAKPSAYKTVRSWRLLKAYDMACSGSNMQTRAFWAARGSR